MKFSVLGFRSDIRIELQAPVIYPSLVLDQPRKTRPSLTGRMLMGCKESDQTNKTRNIFENVLHMAFS